MSEGQNVLGPGGFPKPTPEYEQAERDRWIKASMPDHDPLCRWPTVMVKVNGPVDGVEFAGCDCNLIANVRADERERIAAAIEATECAWVQFQKVPENTTHIAYVHENGETYCPEFGWGREDLLLEADAKNSAYPLMERAAAARIARGSND